MKEISLKNAQVGTTCHISRCLSPSKDEVYRLLEMGICKGAVIKILGRFPLFGAIELALTESRICIAEELAAEFLAIEQSYPA